MLLRGAPGYRGMREKGHPKAAGDPEGWGPPEEFLKGSLGGPPL